MGQCPTWWSTPQSLADAVTPTTRCRAVTLPRRETSWNLQGCPKLTNRYQPLVGRSSPYYEDMWRTLVLNKFLANVNSRSRSFAICCRPSVCRLSVVCMSVTLVRPTQAVEIFGNISTALDTLAIRWYPLKISRRSSQGNPSAGGVKHKRGSQV